MASDFLTMAEVAQRLRISAKRAYALAEAGLLPVTRRGSRLFVLQRAWDRWLEQQTNEALANMATTPTARERERESASR
jgi:excisionase family DNA binding protein